MVNKYLIIECNIVAMFLGDFHIHSRFSDGTLNIPQIVDFYGSKGFGAIAITDHICEQNSLTGKAAHYLNQSLTEESFKFYKKIIKSEAARAMEKYNMFVLLGCEISKNTPLFSNAAHIIAIGIQEYISADLSVIEILKEIKLQGGLAIAAHPVFTRKFENQTFYLWRNRKDLDPYIDAWEVNRKNNILSKIANTELPKIASSDFHNFAHIESWVTAFNCEKNICSIFNSIRNKNISYFPYNIKTGNSRMDSKLFYDSFGIKSWRVSPINVA